MPSYMRSGCQGGRTGAGLIVLDTQRSILNPPAGTRQRFCYQVFASDSYGNVYVPMEYIVLGLGDGICQNDFYSVTVSVNGVMQNVVWGHNAWIVNGCDAGCNGLKLAFTLRNATDIMDVCLTMNHVYTTGMKSSCIDANGTVYTGISVAGPMQNEDDACPVTAYQEVDVCLPVTITPYVNVGEAAVTCCGEPTIAAGDTACSGNVGGQCSFTISQRVCVALPVTFGANTQPGEYAVSCGNAGEGNCDDCTAIGNAAVAAAQRAVENGMIQMNGCNCTRSATCQNSQHSAARNHTSGCSSCQAKNGQTRIQDLIRDPMIWKD